MTQELETARVERDRLEAEQQARECEVEQGRARLDEWERRLAEATTAHEADRDRPTRTPDESRNQSSAERQALESD